MSAAKTLGLVGRKAGMTRVFNDAGETVPVTVIEALPNRITQVRTVDTDGYRAPTAEFIDGITYDGRKPNTYIDALPIGLKGQQKVDGSEVVGG